ncbi:MAG TPA: hypothetical protein PKA76_19815, partial [Pirellulaceae bacterium]|nr:hypothetical protein [Pirellulaceae bacterium]
VEVGPDVVVFQADGRGFGWVPVVEGVALDFYPAAAAAVKVNLLFDAIPKDIIPILGLHLQDRSAGVGRVLGRYLRAEQLTDAEFIEPKLLRQAFAPDTSPRLINCSLSFVV